MRHNAILFFLLLFSGMLVSCSFYTASSDIAPPVEIPETYSVEAGESSLPHRWWEAFEDERLNTLVSELLGANLDLEQAWARLDQAEALAIQAGSSLQPRITLEGATTRARTYASSSPSGGDAVPVHTRQHSLGLAASYEIDLWGRIRSIDRAAGLDLTAVRLDLETAVMTLTAQVAQNWYSLIEQTSQLRLARTQVDASSTQLDLVRLRFSLGLASALDVYQQRQQLASLKAQIPLIEAQITVIVHQLNVLLGRAPGTPIEDIPEVLPELWPRPAPGVPADILRMRPDVEAARIRVEAADQRVASAVSDRFPRVTISGSRGYGAQSFADLFDQMIWNAAGSIAAPIYEGKSKRAEIKRTKAVVKERLYAYARVVLNALAEVEDALEREQKQREYVLKLIEQLEISQSTLDEAYNQYINGLSDYLTVLSALNSLQQTQRELLTARSTLISYRIALCRSLGGTWTAEIKPENQTGEKL
jgi:multidrug efflux system outer membrane protein